MATERLLRKYRTCRHCQEQIFGTAETIKSHAVICSFEKRTGLTVVQDTRDFSVRIVEES